MKALVMTEYKKLEYRDVPTPQLTSPTGVLVRIKAAAICGSDVHGFDGSTGRRKPPVIMGHEASGIIEEVGPLVKNFAKGDRVTFDSTIWCGSCSFCQQGKVNLCDNRRVLGVSCDEYKQDGIFAEFALLEERILYKLPDNLDFIQAAMAEPAGVAAHAISLAPPALGEDVAVVGTGLIGLLILKLLRPITSGKIVALEPDEARRKKALACGADYAFDPREPGLLDKIATITDSGMLDKVYEAVGATGPINTAIEVVKKGGSVVLVGNVSPKVELPLQKIVTRQIRLQGSCAISGEYPTVIKLMASGRLVVDDLISKTAPLSEGQLWFDKLYNREDNLLKVVLLP
ncbi:alcohol dehydrogenase catalytic domain-containing protein [Sphaerochaeta sp. PS]|uniref:zinc-dependent alcohol dehydrogenase n=1 Tax=Sphaerochaeta sp. PS TaxID=3076336 RepID=UPI0028A2EE95|nr:alcohol dehydrogenase catalytic domain-containing protein [Sphaerochaeta sp. PS]MDT4763040.1 alcohol dehydrogenase catalytic domain-containing protein [Sphaerochaeta sp. PS]